MILSINLNGSFTLTTISILRKQGKRIELEGLEAHILFQSPEKAARNFAVHYNGVSIKSYREFAAMIYSRKVNGKLMYAYNNPVKGSNAGANEPKTISKKAKPEAIIHSHGGYEKKYDNNNFSPADKKYSEYEKRDIYVVTPQGTLKKYDVETNNVSLVAKDIPSDPKDPMRLNIVDTNKKPKVEKTIKVPIDIN